jgi:hypothetical protein
MSTAIDITLSEFQFFLKHLELPSETRLRIIFEDNAASEMLKRKRAIESMRKLRGSGNGNLLNALLREREKDKLK